MRDSKKSYHKYIFNEMLISSGIVNGIINGIIFYLLNMKKTIITLDSLILDFTITMVLIAIILGLLQPALLKPKIKSGKVPSPGSRLSDHMVLKFFGRSSFLDLLMTIVIATVIGTTIPIGTMFCFGVTSFSVLGAALVKCYACTICGMTVFYLMGNSYILKNYSSMTAVAA